MRLLYNLFKQPLNLLNEAMYAYLAKPGLGQGHEDTKKRQISIKVSVHRTLKLENRNWKFGLHAFVLLMNAFNFGPSFSTIALNGYRLSKSYQTLSNNFSASL